VSGGQEFVCAVKDDFDLSALHGRKLAEEFLNRAAFLEGAEKGVDRNTGSREARRTALDVGINRDGRCGCHAGNYNAQPTRTSSEFGGLLEPV
jgi:hypothetical protein